MRPPPDKTPSLRIGMLGPFSVYRDDLLLPPLRTRKGQWLLALLILCHKHPLERDWLAGTLWPESRQSQALANLRLTNLRKALAISRLQREGQTKRLLLPQEPFRSAVPNPFRNRHN